MQPVLAQNRPDQLAGAWKEREPPEASSKPVVPKPLLPELAKIPGQTVKLHRFTIVTVAPLLPTQVKMYMRRYEYEMNIANLDTESYKYYRRRRGS